MRPTSLERVGGQNTSMSTKPRTAWTLSVLTLALAFSVQTSLSSGVAAAVPGVGAGQPAQAEQDDLARVLEAHRAARGGDAAMALLGYRAQGVVKAGSAEMALQIDRLRPASVRTEIESPVGTIVQAYDGELPWGVDPMAGQERPEALGSEQAKQVARQAPIDGVLLAPDSVGASLRYIGRETRGGSEYDVVEATYEDGDIDRFLLGVEDALVRRIDTRAWIAGGGSADIEVEMTWKSVDGIQMVDTQTVNSPSGQLQFVFREYELNPNNTVEFSLPGQTAEPGLELAEILGHHRKVRLPEGNAGVKTLRATGQVTFQGFQVPATLTFERPRSARVSLSLGGLEMILATDGETAWTISPMQGITEPETLEGEAADAVGVFSDFVWGLLTNPEARGVSLALEGVETLDRDETYVVVETDAAGKERRVQLGGEDFLEHRITFVAALMGDAEMIEARLGRYQTIDAVTMPHAISLGGSGLTLEMTIDTVDVNPAVDSTIFSMPEVPEAPESDEAQP